MIDLLVEAGIWAGIYAYNRWLAPQPPTVTTTNEAQLPRTEQGTPVPLIFGRVRVKSPILAFASPITRGVNSYNGYADPLQWYGMDLLFVAGIGMAPRADGKDLPALHNLWAGDTSIIQLTGSETAPGGNPYFQTDILAGPLTDWQGSLGHNQGVAIGDPNWVSSVPIDAVTSGIPTGALTFFDGRSTQTLVGTSIGNTMALCIGPNNTPGPATALPGYRNYLSFSLTGIDQLTSQTNLNLCNFGGNPNIQGISAEISTFGAGTFSNCGSGGAFGGVDADPIECLYEIITSDWGKASLPTTSIDVTSFQAASNTLNSEGNGYSYDNTDSTDASDVVTAILAQIDGVLFVEPTDGKFHIKLIRNDYNPLTIPSFTVANIISFDDYAIGSWTDCVNQVTVQYTDRLNNYQIASIDAINLANTNSQGRRAPSSPIQYLGCTNLPLANSLANRDLQMLGQPLAKGQLVVNRDGVDVRPGDAIMVTFPEYNVQGVIFRVIKPDYGSLFDGKIALDLVADAFQSAALGFPLPTAPGYIIQPYPILASLFTEAPRFLQYLQYPANPDAPRVLAVAAPSFADSTYKVIDGTLLDVASNDIVQQSFVFAATVQTFYSRSSEPTDNSVGLSVTLIAGTLPPTLTLTTAQNSAGVGILSVGSTVTGSELMAFTSVTHVSGSTYLINGIQRGLLDTAAKDHAVGEYVFLVSAMCNVGQRTWPITTNLTKTVRGQFLALSSSGLSGAGTSATCTIAGRAIKPLPPAAFTLSGEGHVTGTQGLPAVAGQFNAVSSFEENLIINSYLRNRLNPSIAFGLANDNYTALTDPDAETYDLRAQKVGGSLVTVWAKQANGYQFDQLLIGGAGYGAIDVSIQSRLDGAGARSGILYRAWSSPTIRVNAPRWRNLLGDVRWNRLAISGPPLTSQLWSTLTSGAIVPATTSSLSRSATYGACRYLTGSSTSGSPVVAMQTIDVTGYAARGMNAVAVYYYKNLASDSNDTMVVTLLALNAAGATLATATSGTITPSSTLWTKGSLSFASLPANTVSLQLTATLTEVSGGGDAWPDTAITELCVRLGQWITGGSTLTNANFEAGTMTGWTAVSGGGLGAISSVSYEGQWCAQGSSATNSESEQEYVITDGWQYATAVVVCGQMASQVTDTGTVILEARNAAGTVLGSVSGPAVSEATTGAANVWTRTTISLDLPEGTTKVRVRLLATCTNNIICGANFDDFDLQIHRQLDPSWQRVFGWDVPTAQVVPASWQAFYQAYPSLPTPSYSYNGTDMSGSYNWDGLEIGWADAALHTVGKLVGQFGGGVASVPAYVFTRQTGATATDIKSSGQGAVFTNAFTSTASFTVLLFFTITEAGFSTACGLTGRADLTGGWGLTVNSSGHVVATLTGVSGSASCTLTKTVADAGFHMAAIVYDCVAKTVTAYDERGAGTPASTSAIGEFARNTNLCPFRIGRDSVASATIPGMIPGVYSWPGTALTAAQIAAQWNYAKDPSGLLTYYTRTTPVLVNGVPDSAGATIATLSLDQFAHAYSTALTLDGGTGLGAALHNTSTNLIPSFAFANTTYWAPDAGATLVQGVLDPRGRYNGVTVTGTAIAGLNAKAITPGAGANLQLAFWARSESGLITSLTIALQNSTPTTKQTVTAAIATAWQMITVPFTAWDNSTTTCIVRFLGNGIGDFDIGGFVFMNAGTMLPAAFPDGPLGVGSALTLGRAESVPIQFNAEGEIVVTGVTPSQVPAVTATIVDVWDGSTNDSRRKVTLDTSKIAHLSHADSAGTAVDSASTAIADPRVMWTARGRWSRGMMLDAATNPYAGVVVAGGTPSAVYGRSAIWTTNTSQAAKIDMMDGAGDVLVRSVVLQSRESKLP